MKIIIISTVNFRFKGDINIAQKNADAVYAPTKLTSEKTFRIIIPIMKNVIAPPTQVYVSAPGSCAIP